MKGINKVNPETVITSIKYKQKLSVSPIASVSSEFEV